MLIFFLVSPLKYCLITKNSLIQLTIDLPNPILISAIILVILEKEFLTRHLVLTGNDWLQGEPDSQTAAHKMTL